MLEVTTYGDPILRKKAAAIATFDAALKTFAEEMIVAMKENDGVGLAAPQVSRSVQLAVVDASGGERPAYVLINPQIIWSSEEREDYEEGCLSVPDIRLKVNRPSRVSVKAQDVNGIEYIIDQAQGLLARALQHEIDHLNGILFVDRVSPLQHQLISGKLKKLAKEQREGKVRRKKDPADSPAIMGDFGYAA